jgi:enoyl-CoA hydratase/carnithine racemase
MDYTDEDAFVDRLVDWDDEITQHFDLPTMNDIIASLEACSSEFGKTTAATLRKRSPLMLHVTLEQIRRGRDMILADDLRMERDLVRNAFALKSSKDSEAVEGIRALAIDKDHTPKWQHARIEDVTRDEIEAYFKSPWPAHAHPLRGLR